MESRRSIRVLATRQRKPDGGFCFISASLLLAAWWAYRSGVLRLYDLRVWFAAFELAARRCVARRGTPVRISHSELHEIVGGRGGKHLLSAIARLKKCSLIRANLASLEMARTADELRWTGEPGFQGMLSRVANHRRRVPVPRRMIRFLASDGTRAVIATAIGHLLRCVYYRDGQCASGGRCKASWIADVFEVGVRNVKAARAKLTSLGWLKVTHTPQRSLNRWGAVVTVNLSWSRLSGGSGLTPRKAVSGTGSAPPYKDRKLSLRSENQKPAAAVGRNGSCGKEGRGGSPSLSRVTGDDLRQCVRLDALRVEAVSRGLISQSECDRLRVFGAAEHALSVGTRNPCGLFATIVRRKLWAFISQRDEDSARRRLRVLDDATGGKSGRRANQVPPRSKEAAAGKERAVDRLAVRDLIRRSLGDAPLGVEGAMAA